MRFGNAISSIRNVTPAGASKSHLDNNLRMFCSTYNARAQPEARTHSPEATPSLYSYQSSAQKNSSNSRLTPSPLPHTDACAEGPYSAVETSSVALSSQPWSGPQLRLPSGRPLNTGCSVHTRSSAFIIFISCPEPLPASPSSAKPISIRFIFLFHQHKQCQGVQSRLLPPNEKRMIHRERERASLRIDGLNS